MPLDGTLKKWRLCKFLFPVFPMLRRTLKIRRHYEFLLAAWALQGVVRSLLSAPMCLPASSERKAASAVAGATLSTRGVQQMLCLLAFWTTPHTQGWAARPQQKRNMHIELRDYFYLFYTNIAFTLRAGRRCQGHAHTAAAAWNPRGHSPLPRVL